MVGWMQKGNLKPPKSINFESLLVIFMNFFFSLHAPQSLSTWRVKEVKKLHNFYLLLPHCFPIHTLLTSVATACWISGQIIITTGRKKWSDFFSKPQKNKPPKKGMAWLCDWALQEQKYWYHFLTFRPIKSKPVEIYFHGWNELSSYEKLEF